MVVRLTSSHPQTGWDSHGTAPLGWEFQVRSLVGMTRLLAGSFENHDFRDDENLRFSNHQAAVTPIPAWDSELPC